MSKKPVLRAVLDDEVPPVREPMSLADAIESGDYLDILLAQRREIVSDLPDEKGPAKAALPRQLALLSKEIEALQLKDAEDNDGGAGVDDEGFDAEAI